MGHEKGPFLKDWIAGKEAELTYIADPVDKTSSMASTVMHDGLSATNISIYILKTCVKLNILSVNWLSYRTCTTTWRQFQ